jgi:hypothetical protein
MLLSEDVLVEGGGHLALIEVNLLHRVELVRPAGP